MARGPKSKSKGAVVGGTVVGGNGTVSGLATVYTAVQNATDLAGAVNTAVQKKIESRPKGTSSSYDPKQKKWASALAIYLFERFQCANEPFPSFARREDWYRIYLLKHQDLGREVPVTYRMQYDNMCKVLDALHIQSSKKTHLNRGGDAVVLRQSQPHMRFLAHPVFSSAEFGAFANEMKPALETPEKPISVAIVEALPELTNFLDTVQTNQIAQSQLAEHTNDRVEQLAALTQQAYVSLSGQIQAVAQKQPCAYLLDIVIVYTTSISLHQQLQQHREPRQPRHSKCAPSPPSAPFSDPTFALPALPGTLPPPPHSVPSVPIYQLSRSLSTIAEVWMEWDVGVNGCASVKELERLYGARWRPSPTERKFFSNRKRL
ncbi:unnamed protein product [Tilletia controversa]|nr:unnamed protein product [Tilletia controversa]